MACEHTEPQNLTHRRLLKAAKTVARNTLWSTLFFSTFSFLFSGCYCLLRNLRKARSLLLFLLQPELSVQKDDPWSPFLSALVSGPALLCEQEERRTELVSFAMPRFAEVLWGMADKRGYVTTMPWGHPLLFSLALVSPNQDSAHSHH